MSDIRFSSRQNRPPESVCSLPCQNGQAKKLVEGESCCWHCFNCSTYQIRMPDDETHCVSCPLGTLPDAQKINCQNIPEVYLRIGSAWAIGAMSFGLAGIVVTSMVIGVFIKWVGVLRGIFFFLGNSNFLKCLAPKLKFSDKFGAKNSNFPKKKFFFWIFLHFPGFDRHNDTPVVRASGRELSYVLLAGIVMCYFVTFLMILRPSDIACSIQR